MIGARDRSFPPGPSTGVLATSLRREVNRDPLRALPALVRQYGDVVHFRIGKQHVYFLAHPDDIRGVLSTHYANFQKGRGIRRSGKFLGASLITSEGEQHQRSRRLVLPAFQRSRVDRYVETMVTAAAGIGDEWREGATIDVQRDMRRVALRIVSEALFGTPLDPEAVEISDAIRDAASDDFKPLVLPQLAGIRQLRRLIASKPRQARLRSKALTARIIARRAETPPADDFLSILLDAANPHGAAPMSRAQLYDEVLAAFVAGHETVSLVLTWTWALLAEHPEVERTLHAEIDRVVGDGPITAAAIDRLDYAEMVFAESMRLYPPAWLLMRTAVRDYPIREFTAPRGSLIVLSEYVTQRDERFFPDPLRFDPLRWTPAERAARHPYAYFPFGGGVRRCLGELFAWKEGGAVLAALARRWQLRPITPRPVVPDVLPFLGVRGGMWMRVERRM